MAVNIGGSTVQYSICTDLSTSLFHTAKKMIKTRPKSQHATQHYVCNVDSGLDVHEMITKKKVQNSYSTSFARQVS